MTTEIAPFKGEFAILGDGAQEYLDILEENTGSREIDLRSIPTYTFPGSGDDRWRWVDNGGETHRLDTIIGTVLGQRIARTLYRTKYTDGGIPPDCQSEDGTTGNPLVEEGTGLVLNTLTAPDGQDVVFGGACAACPLNQWESAYLVGREGNGKACREQRVLVVQQPNDPTPIRVRIPPTALMPWRAFGDTLAQSRLRLSESVIELGLEVPKGKSLAELRPTLLASLPKETSVALKALVPNAKRPQLAAPVEQEPEVEPF